MAKSSEQFKHDMTTARGYVSAELKRHGIDIDVRLLTTISVMTSIAMKYLDGDIEGTEARKGFDNAVGMYNSSGNVPF